MPPPVALRREEPRKPHPKSLVPLAELFADTATGADAAASRHAKQLFVPPLSHRRNKATSPLEVRMRANVVSILGIDMVNQAFRASFFVECSWIDYGLAGVEVGLQAGTTQTISKRWSNQKDGYIITNEDQNHYYFAPMLRFRNLVESTELEEFYDVALEERDSTGRLHEHPPPVVTWRIMGTATFHTLFELYNFPLDSQTFAIEIMSAWDKAHVRLKRNLKENARSIICRETFTLANEYELSGQIHLLNRDSDPKHSSSMTSYSYISVQMHVRRGLSYWAWNVWLPLFWFTGLSFAAFLVEVTALANRLTITLTILLTLVSYRFSIMQKLPQVDYLTVLDWFFQLCFGVVFAMTLQCVVLAYRVEQLMEPLEPGTSWQDPGQWQAGQRVALVWTSVAWLGLNAALPLLVMMARRVQRSSEALHWWDCRSNVLWIGPVCSEGAESTSRSVLQRALDEAAHARRQRPTSPPGGPGQRGADDEPEEAEDVERKPYDVRIASVRVIRPAQLEAERRHMAPGTLPRTRQPFLLLELRTQAQAYEALKLLREAEARDAATRALELATGQDLEADANGGVTRAVSRRASLRDLMRPGARKGPPTLEECVRAWRLDDRRVVVEVSLPEYKHLLGVRPLSIYRPLTLSWWSALFRHMASPRRSSTAARSMSVHLLPQAVAYSDGTAPRVSLGVAGSAAAMAREARRSVAHFFSERTSHGGRRTSVSLGAVSSTARTGSAGSSNGTTPPPTPVVEPGASSSALVSQATRRLPRTSTPAAEATIKEEL